MALEPVQERAAFNFTHPYETVVTVVDDHRAIVDHGAQDDVDAVVEQRGPELVAAEDVPDAGSAAVAAARHDRTRADDTR